MRGWPTQQPLMCVGTCRLVKILTSDRSTQDNGSYVTLLLRDALNQRGENKAPANGCFITLIYNIIIMDNVILNIKLLVLILIMGNKLS